MSFFAPAHRAPDVSGLYQQLRSRQDPQARRRLVQPILENLLVVGSAGGRELAALSEIVIREVTGKVTDDLPHMLRPGEFTPMLSSRLIKNSPRVRGFGCAIARATDVRTFADLGTGSAALWPLLITYLHPESEGLAVEINPDAAETAQEMVRLFGVSDRVNVVHGDAERTELPSNLDLGVTETHNKVGSLEPGAALAYRMRHARIMVPSEMHLLASDIPAGPETQWQPASIIDLRQPNSYFTGQFPSTRAGRLPVFAYAQYHGDTGPILTNPLDDTITNSASLGVVNVANAGDLIHFEYVPGTSLTGKHTPELWSTPAA